MEKQDKIIVLKTFGGAIEANIAKTKLDAYGIPCFLSEENLANLYPIQNPRFSVRLHIFEKDKTRATEVLSEVVQQPDEEPIRCPRCKSANIETGYSRKPASIILSLFFSLFFVLFPPKTVSRCKDCDQEF
ncbi:MAG: DUF2007 domain-containing protein [Flammeovirgaceae bacterium]|nr:MAG: DUF2007 domain-containing protein [Flammeovirgaceae bacterium]